MKPKYPDFKELAFSFCVIVSLVTSNWVKNGTKHTRAHAQTRKDEVYFATWNLGVPMTCFEKKVQGK